ncbi:hypothetical protein AGABI2DRAFT_185437 [Agaricus bisporus var. bisporus H97]|uniref:hypothetical protein n=1 Tax=Agaricus bisporus var. bisporus (strain H97 / ATCC MYA-4626 / FGSC 10389) TaxID=936046 RepID=UPI00029F5C48|nr:hypothetical protein AGABI2DRAFT_185437 [Agaricus bisporus var. bisporus H97]EKV47497.1 hypothetical protein AGABI2DRAFT_185437 [Agaricus bisporus var. bisporus H97]
MLDRLVLVACILIVLALIVYFFYWNRILGFMISCVLRILYWNQEASSCWIEIGSIHFSLLAGRILLKDVHYHSSNQTIRIVKSQIQWRYWIRRPMTADDLHVKGDVHQNNYQLSSCRIQVTLQGFEWFLYNRTAAYENILSRMEESLKRESSHSMDRNRSLHKLHRFESPPVNASHGKYVLHLPRIVHSFFSWLKHQMPVLDAKDLLPLGIQVFKGAITCGNTSTPSLLATEFSVCQGTFGITRARSKYDLHKQALALKFRNVVMQLAENEDYVDPTSTLGELLHERVDQYPTLRNASSYLSYRSFRRIWRQLGLYPLTSSYGLNRQRQRNFRAFSTQSRSKRETAVEEETPIGADFATLEYAVERKMLETPVLELDYFVDIVGDVPPLEDQMFPMLNEFGNGDISPDWILELVVSGGTLRFGPWAQRQIVELQKVFFPPMYETVEETRPVAPGEKRIWTCLKIFIELRDQTTLHIPFRESSKDWQWDGLTKVPKRSRRREPAFINAVIGDRSSINYIIPMVAGPTGYEGVFEVHLDEVTVTSSLNDICLIAAESCRIHGDLPSPLTWNDERTWILDVAFRQPVLYLLRDHINMLADLGKDWASGPPSDWRRWYPLFYSVKANFHRYEINLYANDQNIIDKPLVREDNALLILRGETIEFNTVIPSNIFRPESTTIEFITKAPKLALNFSLPRWNTRAAYMPKDGCCLANVGNFVLKGTYHYYSEVRENFIDHLNLTSEVSDLVYQSLGWATRYWMVVRDNYLGSFTSFSTLYEYLDRRKRNVPVGDPVIMKYRQGKANMFHITLSFLVNGGAVVLPASDLTMEAPINCLITESPGVGSCVVLTFSELQIYLRLHDFFFEMSLNVPTIYGHIDRYIPVKLSYERMRSDQKIMMIDGLDIVANRLSGPLPGATTYMCIWEINLRHCKLDMTINDAQILAEAGRSFGLGFKDVVNAPAAEYMPPVEPDITFYKVNVGGMEATLRIGNSALHLICNSGIKLESNDLGGANYAKSLGLRILHVGIKVLLKGSTERNTWLEAADVMTDLHVDMYTAPKGFKAHIAKQRAFVAEQDKPTDRAAKVLSRINGEHHLHKNGVYIPSLTLPEPRVPNTYAPPQKRSSTSNIRPHSIHSNASDSDGHGMISEVDRDARLAMTRSSTPLPVRGEETLSSGDESDDADLTDGDSTDSEWADLEGRASSRDLSLLMYYAHLTRHYTTTQQNEHGFWDGPSFILAKVSIGNSIITTRLRFKQSVNIKLTPLLLPVFVLLQQELFSIKSCLESKFDYLIGEYNSLLASTSKEETDEETRNHFEVICPAIMVSVVQNLSVSEEGHPKIVPHLKESHLSSKFDIAAEIALSIEHISLVGDLSKSGNRFKSSAQSIRIRLDTLPNRSHPPPTETPIFDCCISVLGVDSRLGEIDVCWADFTVSVGHSGPELLTAASTVLKHGILQIVQVFRAIREHEQAVLRAMIYEVLQLSEGLTIIDPLSTIQPSYLVQEGIPHRLRTDPTFRFLFHLRNCLRSLSPEERERVSAHQCNPYDVDPDSFESALRAQSMNVDHELDITHDSSLLDELLKIARPEDQKNAPPPRKLSKISLEFRKTCLRVYASTGLSHNEFLVDGIQIHVSLFPLGFLQPLNLVSMSQTSLREKRPSPVERMSIQISISSISTRIYSHLMEFIQQVLRVRRLYLSEMTSVSAKSKSVDETEVQEASTFYIDASIVLHSITFQAAAANLIFEVGAKTVQAASLMSSPHGHGQEARNASLLFDKVYLQAHSPVEEMKSGIDQGVLAAFEFTRGKVNAVTRQEQDLRKNVKMIFSFGGLRFRVPRSAIKLYRFVEEWRADFLPGIEEAVKATLSELHIPTDKLQSPPLSIRSDSKQSLWQINGQIVEIEISLQVMHGTWLSWKANRVIAYSHSSPAPFNLSHVAFGLQIASNVLEISTKVNTHETVPNSRVKLTFPSLSLGGSYDGRQVQTLVIIDYLDIKVKPSHWDTMLVVQQKFGQDFNDLVGLIQETRMKSSSKPRGIRPGNKLMYSGFLKMQGFRVGFEGFSSTMYLECQDVGGGLRSDKGGSWDINLTDFSLSLAPRSTPMMTSFNRSRRSVFVVINAHVFAGKQKQFPFQQTLELAVTKIHAVMQPSSIGEIGDFIDQLQAEILERKEQRVQELAAFKQKTQSIMKTFEIKVPQVHSEQTSWLSKYLINVAIKNLGVAFPITLDDDFKLSRYRTKDTPVSAFLFSVSSIMFAINRGETGEAGMNCLSFQFVSQFRQSEPSDFDGAKHRSRNCLIYPEMKAQLRSILRADSRQLWVNASVSGFILDLDSTIADYVCSLIDVYRQGKERLEQLSSNVTHTPLLDKVEKPALEKHYHAIPTSNVFASLTFLSGKVRMYSSTATRLYQKRNMTMPTGLSDEQILEVGAEIFYLPVVSVWAEYRAIPALHKSSGSHDGEPSTLMFKCTVHSSQNVLRPTLLPFLTELVKRVETRIYRNNSQVIQSPEISQSSSMMSIDNDDSLKAVSSLRISFSLRIDCSKLELTCRPDVNVVAGLRWESGGFILNISPRAHRVSFTGTVGGLSIGLRHGFLREDCLQLDARDLTFSVTFSKTDDALGYARNSVSLIVDTEFHSKVRFSRLQDILCFKAVWLDRFPVFINQSTQEVRTPLKLTPNNSSVALPPVKQSIDTILLVRIRRINLEVDLGQSISKITLYLNQTILRTKLTEKRNEVAIYVGELSIIADGNLSGRARVCDCLFQTIRRTDTQLSKLGDGRMLELRLTSGPLTVSLESDRQRLLQYHAEPLEVEIYDDWTSTSLTGDHNNPLRLFSVVTSPEIVAAVTIGTIPKLMSYANKFEANLEAQQDNASRESAAFRGSRSLKPDNPLSTFAEALLQTSKAKFKEADSKLSFVIRQSMSLRLDHMRFVVFPRSMEDTEMAQFEARDVQAHLNSLLATNQTPMQRDLRLSFSSMVISKYTRYQPLSMAPVAIEGFREWLQTFTEAASEATIVGLPSMKMHMTSEMVLRDDSRDLFYDFHSSFVRQGMKEIDDIYITLNVALYSWLTLLRKNMSREMDQVRATAEWRTSLNSGVGSPIILDKRRKALDPSDMPTKSTTLPTTTNPITTPTSPVLGSSSARSVAAYPLTPPQGGLSPSIPPIQPDLSVTNTSQRRDIKYEPRNRSIERLTMRQLGDATPDVMHPFFMKKAGFNLEDSLPQYVDEYATRPLEEIMEVLLKLYSRQLKVDR